MIYFTADTHFNHKNIIQYCNRPFDSIEEMDDVLVQNWNSAVTPKDDVYHLGDFIWGKGVQVTEFRKRLNGNIHLIVGNHDNVNYQNMNEYGKTHNLKSVTLRHDLKVGGELIVLSHFCMRVWNKSHFNSWHAFGHSHGRLDPIGKSWDVGVDNNNFKPISFDELKSIMESRPDNPNLIKNKYD